MGVGSAPGSATHYSDAPPMPYNLAAAPAGNMQRPASDQSFGPTSQSSVGPTANGSWSMHNPKPNPMLFHSNPASPDQFGLASNNTDDKRNVMANPHQQPGEEWMFHGPNDGYMNPMFSTNMGPGYEHPHNGVKKEYDHHDGNASEYYIPSTSLGADGTLGLPSPFSPLGVLTRRKMTRCDSKWNDLLTFASLAEYRNSSKANKIIFKHEHS